MPPESPLAGRRILITGATGTLGSALALSLAQAGAELILLSRRKARLEELDDAIAAQSGKHPLLVELDFLRANEGHYQELAQALTTPGIDDVVLCSGLHTGLHPLDHLPTKDWYKILNVNLNGPFLLIRHLLPLIKRSGGHLIGVSDPVSREPKAFWGGYAVSKAALDALLEICAQETEGRVAVHRFEPAPMPSPIRAAVYPGESRDSLPSAPSNVDEILQILGQNHRPERS